MSVPWNRTTREVDEPNTWQPARILGRSGRVTDPVKLPARLPGFTPSLDWFLLLGCAALLGSGCATKPFNVKSRLASPPASFTARAAVGSIMLQAAVIRDEDYMQTTFDANLILAGILPVKLVLQNGGSVPVRLKSMRFSLSAGGQRLEPMEPRDAFKRLMGYYRIRVYSVDGYKASLSDFIQRKRRSCAMGSR